MTRWKKARTQEIGHFNRGESGFLIFGPFSQLKFKQVHELLCYWQFLWKPTLFQDAPHTGRVTLNKITWQGGLSTPTELGWPIWVP